MQHPGTSLAIQWLGLHASNAETKGSIPGRETKIPHASQHGQIKKKKRYSILFIPRFLQIGLLGTIVFQFSSVAQSCPTLCNPMNRSTPGLPVRHQLPEFTQTHVHLVGNAIQPSHPLSSPFPPALNPSESFPMSQFFT